MACSGAMVAASMACRSLRFWVRVRVRGRGRVRLLAAPLPSLLALLLVRNGLVVCPPLLRIARPREERQLRLFVVGSARSAMRRVIAVHEPYVHVVPRV